MSSKSDIDAPDGRVEDDSYTTKGTEPIPVQRDSAKVEEGYKSGQADTDAQLERDEADAIDESNMIKEKTRHAKPRGTYKEPGDEEGLE